MAAGRIRPKVRQAASPRKPGEWSLMELSRENKSPKANHPRLARKRSKRGARHDSSIARTLSLASPSRTWGDDSCKSVEGEDALIGYFDRAKKPFSGRERTGPLIRFNIKITARSSRQTPVPNVK